MIYDKAHELAKELKELPEFTKYRELSFEIFKDENDAKMVQDYRNQLIELQFAQMQTGKLDEEKLKKFKELEQLLSLNSKVNEFLISEMEFSKIYSDINKIISDAIKIEDEENKEI